MLYTPKIAFQRWEAELPKPIEDLSGRTFERLLVLHLADNRPPRWMCRCTCGNEKVIKGASLKSGATKSCGCYQVDYQRAQRTIHGGYNTSTYYSWRNMIQRCTNSNNKAYEDYLGRGIVVCERWHSFANFLEDMGYCPPGLTIERVNNDGNYELSNCRWASRKEQIDNRRITQYINVDGKSVPITKAARDKGVASRLLKDRKKAGWSDEQAISTPSQRRTN